MHIGKIAFYISVVSIIFANTAYSFEFNSKIGTLNYKKILNESEAGKSAYAKIKVEAEKLERIFKEKAVEIEKRKNQLKIEAPILSQESRTEKQQSLLLSINKLRAFQKKSQMELKRLQDNIYAQFRNEILEITEEIGKNQNYFLILDERNIFYAQNAIDLTENLIREYNEKFLKKKDKKSKSVLFLPIMSSEKCFIILFLCTLD